MKNKKLLLLCMISPLIMSCGNKGESTPSGWDENHTEICISNFEKWGPDFQILGLINDFGKVSRNSNQAWVKSGQYSAHIQPLGQYGNVDKKPLMYIPLKSKLLEFNYGDLSKLNDVKCYLYNDSDIERNVTVGFISSVNAYGYITKQNGESFALAPNAWTRITYTPNIKALNNKFDVTSTGALYFEFEHTNSREIKDAPNFYLDDVYFEMTKEERSITEDIILKENEICDFEEEFQKQYFTPGWPDEIQNIFTYDIKEGEYHGITPTSGDKMLYLSFKAGNRSDWKNWANICFSERYMKATNIKNIAQDDLKNWQLSFDLAGIGAGAQKVVPIFYAPGRTRDFRDYTFDAYNGKWTTFSMKLDESYHVITSNPGEFLFSIPEELYSFEIFIDNIRLERIVK